MLLWKFKVQCSRFKVQCWGDSEELLAVSSSGRIFSILLHIINFQAMLRNIIRTTLFILTLISSVQLLAQSTPDFTPPVDIPVYLSGTFGELRSNHFHSGIDIKTQGTEGKNIIAIEDGWVSRIKISEGGYGKALYITHPNGYMSVYGHLQQFNDEIQKYVIDKQYEQESFTIQIFPDKGDIPVKKGQVIALSGNTGSSMGPHLHFEIRKATNQHPVNPLQFKAIKVKDYYRPQIKMLAVYPVNETSVISGKNDTAYYNVQGWGVKHRVNDTLLLSGEVSFGISTHDLMNDIPNKNGVYNIKVYFDTTLFFEIKMDELSFSKSRYINSLIDYAYAEKTKQRIVRTQLDTNNMLGNYSTIVHNGIINVNDTLQHTLVFEVRDIYKNVSKLSCVVVGDPTKSTEEKTPENITGDYLRYSESLTINDDPFMVDFPANTFYRSFVITHEIIPQKDSLSDILKLHNRFTPAHKYFTIKMEIPDMDSLSKTQTYMAYSPDNDDYYFSGNSITNNTLTVKSRDLGYYKLMQDSITPVIELLNFSDSANISNLNSLKVKITDAQTGIADYRATLNGKWILMEYDAKKNRLTYNYDDRLQKGANSFEISVTDLSGNQSTKAATLIYR